MVVELSAIRPFLLWEGLELLQKTRTEGARRAASSSSRAPRRDLGKFTDDMSALEATFCTGICAEYHETALYELFSSQGIAFESARIATAVTAPRQK